MPERDVEPQLSVHRNYTARVSCVECGWTWDGWIEDAPDAIEDHQTEQEHADDN